jgi:hypothetical protein
MSLRTEARRGMQGMQGMQRGNYDLADDAETAG